MPVMPASRMRSDAALPAGGELDELGAAVVRVRDAVRVAGLLEPLYLPGDVRGLHPQPGRPARRAPGDQVGDPGDLPQDLGGIRGIRGCQGGGGFWLASRHVNYLAFEPV